MAAGVPTLRPPAFVPFERAGGTHGATALPEIDPWFVAGHDRPADIERAIRVRLVAAMETERAHIARELHDVVGQALTAVRLNLLSIERLDGRTGASGAPIDTSLAAVDDAIRQVRTAAFELRPAVLDDLGLGPALRTLCRQVAAQAAMAVACRVSLGEGRLPVDVETACFRVAQEAITNAVRHSGARHVHVSVVLRRRTRTVVLDVRDDGVGFDPAGCSGPVCIGIWGMAERAALVGATLEIRSAPGEGARVTARFREGSSGMA
jgi:signal transduction histidine kinase